MVSFDNFQDCICKANFLVMRCEISVELHECAESFANEIVKKYGRNKLFKLIKKQLILNNMNQVKDSMNTVHFHI